MGAKEQRLDRSAPARLGCVLALMVAIVAPAVSSAAQAYDPLQVSLRQSPAWLDLAVEDARRQRTLPIRVYLPPGTKPAPVVLFSGLSGSLTNNRDL